MVRQVYEFGTLGAEGAAITDLVDYVLVSWPSMHWTGKANSGFSALPVDPERNTAKPVMRLLVPPNQYFTDTILVGVWAAANDGGSLTGNMGLEKVVVHYEGEQVDILSPSYRTLTDGNGKPVTYFGWWVMLKHHGRNGTANLFLEAVPKDSSMQNRVIGPYAFFPSATLHDADLTVAPSQPEIWGSQFQTLGRAMEYIRLSASQNPRVRLMETGLYRRDTWSQPIDYIATGWILIEAAPGVTATIGGDAAHPGSLRTKVGPMHFRGDNLIFDTAYMTEVYNLSGADNWFDGVRFVNSLGQFATWFGRDRPLSWIGRGNPWFTESKFEYQADAVRGSRLARGCVLKGGYNDQLSGCACAIGNVVRDADSSGLRTEVESFLVHYAGTGETATLQVSGRPGISSRMFTVKVDGITIDTFTAVNSSRTGGFYWMSDVVKWLNSLPGISATLLSDRRAAIYVNVPGGGDTVVAPTDIMTVPKTFVARSFPHADLYASETVFENVVIADNLAWNNDVQLMFNGSPLKDFCIVNNSFEHRWHYIWQFSTRNSHVIVSHNSTNYQLWLRGDYSMDFYCMYANNIFETLNTPKVNYGQRIKNNHCFNNTSQTNSPGYSNGGEQTSLFANASGGDFKPAGALLTTRKVPTLGYDRRRHKRMPIDVAGALAQN